MRPPPDLAGRPLPGGRYRITAAENRRVCEAVGAKELSGGRAHPIFFYIAGQVAQGISVADLLALCEFDVDDGPLMTSTRVRFERSLMTEQDYGVTGEILGLVRKPSRAFGQADTLEYALTLSLPSGERVVRAVNTWILPRREKAA